MRYRFMNLMIRRSVALAAGILWLAAGLRPAAGQTPAPPYAPFTPNPAAVSGVFNPWTNGNPGSIGQNFFVETLDSQMGVPLTNAIGNNSASFPSGTDWVDQIQKVTAYKFHNSGYYDLETQNPLVAFGSQEGGTPLYVGQRYRFGVCTGVRIASPAHPEFTNVLSIVTYARSAFQPGAANVQPLCTNVIAIPLETDSAWSSVATNGFEVSLETNGLRTDVFVYEQPGTSFTSGSQAGDQAFGYPANMSFMVIHTASAAATNYYYRVDGFGAAYGGPGWTYMMNSVQTANLNPEGSTTYTNEQLYTLDFDPPRPAWRSAFVDQVQFSQTNSPPTYTGDQLADLTGPAPAITATFDLTSPLYTNLDASPELLRHSVLDQFVQDMGNDPMALAAFVQNDIGLVDAVRPGLPGAPAISINCGSINRSALDTFLEREGSPAEQCALLIYLLRQAGYPAGYVYPTGTNVFVLTDRMSQMLRRQINGTLTPGQDFSNWETQYPGLSNYVQVNYPWVVTRIGGSTIHLFPWIKDTEITEGLNLYDYMPTNINTGYKWVHDYLFGLSGLVAPTVESNCPSLLFPYSVQQSLLTNGPGISLDDIGTHAVDRRHEYARWQDFPVPSIITNQNRLVLVPNFISITNEIPALTNYFDTIQFSMAWSGTPNSSFFTTQPRRVCDLLDREFILAVTNTTQLLYLAPYDDGVTSISNFSGPSQDLLKAAQVLTTPANGWDVLVTVNYFHRNFANNGSWFPGIAPFADSGGNGPAFTHTYDLPPGTVAGLCFEVGAVTPEMLEVHAEHYWNVAEAKALNTNGTPPVTDEAGLAAYLMGMTYFSKISEFNVQCRELHGRVADEAIFGAGMGKFVPHGNNVQPGVDMLAEAVVPTLDGNPRLDIPDYVPLTAKDFWWVWLADTSAQEHEIMDNFFQRTDGISSVRLLQLAQLAATNGNPGIVVLDTQNYQQLGNALHLQSQIPNLWSVVVGKLSSVNNDANNVVFLTPSQVENEDGSYKGSGELDLGSSGSLILGGASIDTNFANGGFGSYTPPLVAPPAANYLAYTLYPQNNSFYMQPTVPARGAAATYFPSLTPTFDLSQTGGSYETTPAQQTAATAIIDDLGVAGPDAPDDSDALLLADNLGYLGQYSSFEGSVGEYIADPVNVQTGEFYIDTSDLSMAGPMPLQIRRNYSSQNVADNEFGYGWKMNLMPFLVRTTNSTTGLVTISAAESDGSVIVYQNSTTNAALFRPSPALDPQLNNDSNGGIGSTGNLFNNSITNYTVLGTNVIYLLNGADGSARTFQVQAFPISTSTNTIARLRPYLTGWQDNRGNNYTFQYGQDPTATDYGQVNRIQSSNGEFVFFQYDVYRHILQAYASDQRRVLYDYDSYGDLTSVTLPDNSEVEYQYLHNFTNSNGTNTEYSTHLISQEIKPEGRTLANIYDTTVNGRVDAQLATVGGDLNLYTNAVFFYVNNVTNDSSKTITGYTLIYDANGGVTRYDYANSLVTTITDSLSNTVHQTWYAPGDTSQGAYPCSLQSRTDKRGLLSLYIYDQLGNLVIQTDQGNLSGGTLTNEAAVTVYTYTSNNLIGSVVDPSGILTTIRYTNTTYPYLPTGVYRVSTNHTLISSNLLFYGATNTVNPDNTTSSAWGLLTKELRAGGASTEWAYDGRGFVTQETQHTGTSDPDVVTYYAHNDSGEMIESRNAANVTNEYTYTPRGQVASREVFAPTGAMLSGEFYYYNDDGDLTWTDGPRYNPDDYVWRDYDGAGRVTQEIHWRSRAKADGTGMEAEVGDNLYATIFKSYDMFNNLTNVTDQHGNFTRMQYDLLGRLVNSASYDGSAPSAPLATEGFGYEPGGQVALETNALGGVTVRQFTSRGQPKFQSNPDGSVNLWTYYLDGRLHTEVLRNGAYHEFVYNDAQLLVTNFFRDPMGAELSQEVEQFDGRGNVVLQMDADTNVFQATYDNLDRLKTTDGPPLAAPSTGDLGLRMSYDAAGLVETTANVAGEQTVTTVDGLGRVISVQVQASGSGHPTVRQSTYSYPADNNSVTNVEGTGSGAITTVAFTDTFGKTALTQHFPNASEVDVTRNTYDVLENLVAAVDELGRTNTFTYDALHRLQSSTLPDGAQVTLGYDAAGDLISRAMPGNLTWHGVYDTAARLCTNWLQGTGGATTRTYVNTYYTTGPVGLLYQTFDPRGFTRTVGYDNWLRIQSDRYTGGTAAQNVSTSLQYDPVGNLLAANQASGLVQSEITNTYDGYGNCLGQNVWLGVSGGPGACANGPFYSVGQAWDNAGRRSGLTINDPGRTGPANSFSESFGYRADGALTGENAGNQAFSYTYEDNGLLMSRSNPWRMVNVTSRDGRGRMLNVTNTVAGTAMLGEGLTWRPDSTLGSYTAARQGTGTWNETRNYTYSAQRGQLLTESFQPDPTDVATNTYGFDSALLGVRISAQTTNDPYPEARLATGSLDAFDRVQSESDTRFGSWLMQTRGRGFGLTNVLAQMDSSPAQTVPVSNAVWTAGFQVTSGQHALHVSSVFSPMLSLATNSTFTAAAADPITNSYDAAGNLINRSFSDGRQQTFVWDALGRLISETQSGTVDGFTWTAAYDALNRRLSHAWSESYLATNTVSSSWEEEFYDPEVEFQELAVGYGSYPGGTASLTRYYEPRGPDLNGVYGGLNGLGGLEGTCTAGGTWEPVLSDAYGNVAGTVTNGTTLVWAATQSGAYGPVPGYGPPALSGSVTAAESASWRGKRQDPTGFYNLGARVYDPQGGRFLSPDPLGHAGSMDLYSFCGGDPVNRFDADGRFGKGVEYGIGDVMDKYSTVADNVLDAVMNPLVSALVNPVVAQEYFPGDHDSGVSYMATDPGGTWARDVGYGVGSAVAEATVQAAMFSATDLGGSLATGEGMAADAAMMEGSDELVMNSGSAFSTRTTEAFAARAGEDSLFAGEEGVTPKNIIGGVNFEGEARVSENTYNVGDLLPNGNIAGVGPGSQYVGETAEQLRNTPGVVTMSSDLNTASGKWLDAGVPAPIPAQVAKTLVGRQFNTFGELRGAIWGAIGENSELSGSFNARNIGNMRANYAPFAPRAFQISEADAGMRFNLHHITAIENGGSVYDLSNLQIVSPLVHAGLH
jgi:RHS repeat-associated protein